MMVAVVGHMVSRIVVYIWRKSVGATIFDIRISGNFIWFTTVLYTLKEEKQDASHTFLVIGCHYR
jgi:hypothetical protein